MTMNLVLSPETTLAHVSEQLTEQYHNLKLVFFTKSHERFKGNYVKDMITDKASLLKDYCSITEEAIIPIEGMMKTYELEELFEERFGLHVQVFRKTNNNSWIETSTTDSRTLHDQNYQAEAEVFYDATYQNEHIDYREQD